MFLIRWINRVGMGILSIPILGALLFFLSLGPAFGVVVWLDYRANQQFESQSAVTQATIEEIVGGGYQSHVIRYTYIVDGQYYHTSEDISIRQVGEALTQGQQVPVYYSPDDPTESRLVANIPNFNEQVWTICLIASLLWIWLSPWMAAYVPVLERFWTNGLWFLVMLFFLSAVMLFVPPISHPSQSWWFMLPFVVSLGFIAFIPFVIGNIRHLWAVQFRQPRLETSAADEVAMMPRGPRNLPEQLHTLGFEYIGKSSYADIPDDQTLYHFGHPHEPIYATYWYAAKTSYYGTPTKIEAVRFDSYFGQAGVVRTSYPIGENIRTGQFESHFAESSLPDAYQLHLKLATAWSHLEGFPITPRDMNGLLHWEALFWERYGRRYQRRLITVGFIDIVLLLALPSFWLWWFWAYRTWEEVTFNTGLAVAFGVLWLILRLPAWGDYYRRTPRNALFPLAPSIRYTSSNPLTFTKLLAHLLPLPTSDFIRSRRLFFPRVSKLDPAPSQPVWALILAFLVLVIALVTVWYVPFWVLQQNEAQDALILRSDLITAHVVELECMDERGRFGTYQFMVGGQLYYGRARLGGCYDPVPNSSISVYYIPDDPTLNQPVSAELRNREPSRWWLALCVSGVGIPLLIGAGMALLEHWRSYRTQRLSSTSP